MAEITQSYLAEYHIYFGVSIRCKRYMALSEESDLFFVILYVLLHFKISDIIDIVPWSWWTAN